MATTLVTALVTQTRRKANAARTNFVTDQEIVDYLNEAGKKFNRLIITIDDSYYQSTLDFSVSNAPSNFTALPADFLAMRAVKSNPDSPTEQPLFVRDIHEDNYNGKVGYYLAGNSLFIVPGLYAATGNPFRLYYLPKPTPLALTASWTIARTTGQDGTTPASQFRFPAAGFTSDVLGGILTIGNTLTALAGSWTILTVPTTTPVGANLTTDPTPTPSLILEDAATVSLIYQPPGTTDRLDVTQDNFAEYFSTRAAIQVAQKKRQDSLVASLRAQLAEIIEDMASMRQSEPKQAPVLWGARRRMLPGTYGNDEWDL